jgi:hypothetical protein
MAAPASCRNQGQAGVPLPAAIRIGEGSLGGVHGLSTLMGLIF